MYMCANERYRRLNEIPLKLAGRRLCLSKDAMEQYTLCMPPKHYSVGFVRQPINEHRCHFSMSDHTTGVYNELNVYMDVHTHHA